MSKDRGAKVLKLFGLCAILHAFLFSFAFAEGPNALMNMNYTETTQYENGDRTQTSDNLYQNYYFRFDKAVTPVISYQLYLRSTLTNAHTKDADGDVTKSYLRALEPAADIFFRTPLYGLDAGYRRLDQWNTANLNNNGRITTDFSYSRFTLTPYELPAFSLQFDGEKEYDHLKVRKTDTAYTKYSGSSWYDLVYKDIRMSYNINYTRDEHKTPLEKVTKTINNSVNGLFTLGYSRTFWSKKASVSAGYQSSYVRFKNEQFAAETGSVSFKRTPSLGMYGSGVQLQPDVDTLASTISLSDNIHTVPAASTSGVINIGQNGKRYHNIGVQLFSSEKPVDTICVYVNKDITGETNLTDGANWRVYRSSFNLPGTWAEIAIQSVTVSAYDSLHNIYRYEIRLISPQNSLYFKAVNMENASVIDLLVTEIEVFGTDEIPQSGKTTDVTTFFTQGINFNASLRPVQRLTFSLNYFLNRSDQNPASIAKSIGGAFANLLSDSIKDNGKKLKSNITRAYGLSSVWFAHRLLTTTVRFLRNEAFDNNREMDLRSDTYSVSFSSAPLPTLDTNLSYVRTYTYNFTEKQSMNNLYLLTIGARIYRDVNMITDVGYTQSKTYAGSIQENIETAFRDTSSSTRYIRGTLDTRFTPNLSGNLTYGLSRTSGSTSSQSNDVSLIVTYRPGRFISLSGSFRIADTDDETRMSEGILLDWLIVPSVRFNLSYEHINTENETEAETETTDTISGYVIWYITRFLDLQVNYSYIHNDQETKRKTYNLGANFTGRFW